MEQRLLFVGYNYYPEPTGIGKYSGEMIYWLAEKGYQCTVVTAYPYYPHWQVQEPYAKRKFWYTTERKRFASGGSITLHRCPTYVPAKPSGLKRVLLEFTFFVSAWLKLLFLLPGKKFDYVVTVIPSVLLGLIGIVLNRFHGARTFCHIHDLQLEAARDLGMIKPKQALSVLFKLEKYIFRNTDIITCTGEGMVRKTQQKTKKHVRYFPNWTDLNKIYPLVQKSSLKEAYGFAPSDKVMLYSGAIGEKQGLESILLAAEKFAAVPGLKFVICGSGPYKEKLEVKAAQMQLQNVVFMPLQPFETFNEFLNMADVHLIIQKANACDLVMPSKLTTVLTAGGVALITAGVGSDLHALVDEHQMGILVEAENQTALLQGIETAITEDCAYMGRNARRFAEENLSIDTVVGTFEKLMTQEAEQVREEKLAPAHT